MTLGSIAKEWAARQRGKEAQKRWVATGDNQGSVLPRTF